MIDYQTYCQIRHLFTEKKLGLRQIARELKLGLNTVCKWARRESFKRGPIPKRASKLDPFKGEIIRLLGQHAYSAQQIFRCNQGHSTMLRVRSDSYRWYPSFEPLAPRTQQVSSFCPSGQGSSPQRSYCSFARESVVLAP